MEPKISFGRAPEEQERRPVTAGTVISMVAQACAQCEVAPGAVLDYAIKPGRVILLLPNGQKVSFLVEEPELPQPTQPENSGLARSERADCQAPPVPAPLTPDQAALRPKAGRNKPRTPSTTS